MHIFLGPRDARLNWTGFGLQVEIVEACRLLSAVLHVAVALKRMWAISLNCHIEAPHGNFLCDTSPVLNHQFVAVLLGDTEPRRNNLITLARNLAPLVSLSWMICDLVKVGDIYRLKFEVLEPIG